MNGIEQLYSATRFEAVLYYFKANDILDLAALKNFDFQELMFVPGVSPALAEEAKRVYVDKMAHITNSAPLEALETKESESSTVHNINNTAEPQASAHEHVPLNIEIAEIYTGVPRSAGFINWCNTHGKKYMHQLCDDDFEEAKDIKGLGLSSVENLRAIYQSFLTSEHSELITQVGGTPSISGNTPIDNIFASLPHSKAFCAYCHSMGFHTLLDLKGFSFDLKEIKGIGASSMSRLQQAYFNAIMQEDASPMESSEFTDIPAINYGIAIPYKALTDEGYVCIGDLCQRGLPVQSFVQIKVWLETYKKPIIDIFINELLNMKENARYCLTMRANGQTLQQIADHIGVTRERVRQIVSKAAKALAPTATLLTDAILYPNKQFFCFDDLLQLFPDPIYAEVYRFIIKQNVEFDGIAYLDFADKFIKGSLEKSEYEELLCQVAEDEIGEGINFFDNLEQIDAQLKESIPVLDFSDLMNFLVNNGYHFYGDYVMRGRQSYAIVCADAVRKYFPQGIKLNNDENNEDLIHLRRIISRHYTGIELPENNRALSARMMSVLIQSGRSQYCHISSVIYSVQLFDEIYDYMQSAEQPSFHYSELFEVFKGRLLAETNITDYNFLHGMLKHLFLEDFDFSDRDIVTKSGESKQNADDRLKELLLSNGSPLSKKEIKKALPGINEFVIAFSVSREEKLISWDYNTYNHIDNLVISDEDISKLSAILYKEINNHGGYLSDNLLYDIVRDEFPTFLEKNKMTNEINLYYTVAYLFKESYRFRRPHILSLGVNVGDMSLINIAKYLLNCQDGLNYKEYLSLSAKFGWANGTIHSIFSELEKEFIRISENDYIPRNLFVFDSAFLTNFTLATKSLLNESGYFALFSFFAFQGYPECQFEWNGFLVGSLIQEYNVGLKILSPQVKDRRYQRGIVVEESHPSNSFEELVAYVMKKDNLAPLNEADFCEYLKQKGLIYITTPQELYNCAEISYKNEMFSATQK